MSDETKTVAAITLQCDQPTELSFKELRRWVIWQFPIPRGGGLCGAVRPPIANYGWLPAVIRGKKQQVLVHGHLDKTFNTPQAAADWLARNKDKVQ
jgi:hypothetical protein